MSKHTYKTFDLDEWEAAVDATVAELDRLKAANAELVEALKGLYEATRIRCGVGAARIKAKAALAKAGVTQ